MEIRTKIYDCKNLEQNPIPRWMGYYGKADIGSLELNLLEQFKKIQRAFPQSLSRKSEGASPGNTPVHADFAAS